VFKIRIEPSFIFQARRSRIKMILPKLRQEIRNWRPVLVAAPTVAGLVTVLRLTGFFQYLSWDALDQFFIWRPAEAPDPRIVIVTIDETDLKQVGKWPIPDQTLAELLLKIKSQQPRAIG